MFNELVERKWPYFSLTPLLTDRALAKSHAHLLPFLLFFYAEKLSTLICEEESEFSYIHAMHPENVQKMLNVPLFGRILSYIFVCPTQIAIWKLEFS